MNRKWQIPDGVQDTLAIECYNKREVESSFRHAFFTAGYEEIETPGFEYYDVFASGIGSQRQESLIKFFDEKGRILAMRPEFTVPIARIVASRNEAYPARYCYVGNAYGSDGNYYGSQKEFTQAGIELIGETAPEADAEVISVAASALHGAGLKDIQVDIGQVEFFKGLMEEAGLTREESELLRTHIDRKDDLAVELFLNDLREKGHSISASIADTIRQFSTLYGGAEVFDRADAMSSSEHCHAAIQNLRQIYKHLCEFGLEDCISIDLGMLQSIDYYSGLIFKGYAGSIGFPILSGGRYDKLLREFGADTPATGCAIGLKRVLIAMERESGLKEMPKIDVVVSADENRYSECYAEISKMRAQGKRVIAALQYDRPDLQKYADFIGAEAVYFE